MTDMSRPIAVAPREHPWHASVCEVVEQAGGTLVSVEEARGLVWLAKGEQSLHDVLHPDIEWVQLRAAGVERWIQSGEIDDKRVFTAARGVYSQAVAEHVLALILAASRRLHVCARATHWDAQGGAGGMLRGATVGILGAGGVGREVIDHLAPFGVNIVAATRSGRQVPGADRSLSVDQLDKLWPAVDYLVVSAPATEDTTALVGAEQLRALPGHAWLINVARGSLVDTEALVKALRTGEIAGAALDVTEPEPLPDGHPLWELPNVLITPHVANPKSSHQMRLEERIAENVRRFVSGDELLGVVDLSVGY